MPTQYNTNLLNSTLNETSPSISYRKIKRDFLKHRKVENQLNLDLITEIQGVNKELVDKNKLLNIDKVNRVVTRNKIKPQFKTPNEYVDNASMIESRI